MIPVYLNLLVVVAIGVLLTHCQLQRRTFQQIISGRFGQASDPLTTARRFAGWIHAHVPRRQDDPLFISPVFHLFGATPIAVLHAGGCCSGLSRLCILGLDALGIRAAQITLYHVSGCAQHCAVEAMLGGDRMIVDPTYGLYYTDGDGEPLGLERLQAGCLPKLQTLPLSAADAYPPYPYYDFNYETTKTANWTRSAPRRLSHSPYSLRRTHRPLSVARRTGVASNSRFIGVAWGSRVGGSGPAFGLEVITRRLSAVSRPPRLAALRLTADGRPHSPFTPPSCPDC
jgi:hypothetical protein